MERLHKALHKWRRGHLWAHNFIFSIVQCINMATLHLFVISLSFHEHHCWGDTVTSRPPKACHHWTKPCGWLAMCCLQFETLTKSGGAGAGVNKALESWHRMGNSCAMSHDCQGKDGLHHLHHYRLWAAARGERTLLRHTRTCILSETPRKTCIP